MRRFDTALRAEVSANLAAFDRRCAQLDERKAAGVAIALLPDEEGRACFVLTRRTARVGSHKGQWALPGGRREREETSEQAAVRELEEEVGIAAGQVTVLGVLDDYATRSGYVITPVVVWCEATVRLEADPREVAAAYRVAVSHLEGPDLPHLREIPESDRPVISLPLLDTHIHAPTAAVLYQFREVALLGRATRVDHFEEPVFAWR
ncbi:MAG: CoA pyrophosphatase [Myxococcales bacterium]|nr:MAG: CoA pyrophosphatase [Myxococcales bacterium]